MKKIYNSPVTRIVKLNAVSMIALSKMEFNGGNGKSGTVLTREDNSWDIWGTGDDFED